MTGRISLPWTSEFLTTPVNLRLQLDWDCQPHRTRRRVPGGALLGLRGLVFKSHGSADVRAFGYALERAYDASRYDLLDRVKARVARAAPLLALSGATAEG